MHILAKSPFILHSKEQSLTNGTNDQLRVAAQVGDINHLYTVIQADPHVLEHMDVIPFVDTPLHIAGSAGHLRFATEIMRLKPSLAWKLNQQGFCPIHLAIQQGHKRMVIRFVEINRDLVRVKGREGMTPLHLVSQTGVIDLLANFLDACPDSIEDVTVRSETALHIAVTNQQYQAHQVLVGWLERTYLRGNLVLKETILNWEDDAGNTVLHILAQITDSQALGLLTKNIMINLKAKNLDTETALDIADSAEMRSILVRAGAKSGSSVTDAPTLQDKLKSKITLTDKIFPSILHVRENILADERITLLVAAVLVATAINQGAVSPPGGVFKADNGANNLNTASLNSTDTFMPVNAGKSIMPEYIFFFITLFNSTSLLASTVTIFILTLNKLACMLLGWLSSCYFLSMLVTSPSSFGSTFLIILVSFSILRLILLVMIQNKGIESQIRFSTGGNRW